MPTSPLNNWTAVLLDLKGNRSLEFSGGPR